MDFLEQLFHECGWLYSFLLVGSFAAGLIYLAIRLIRRSKRSALAALGAALLPLAIGLYGTYDGNRAIDYVLNTFGVQPDAEELAYAYRIALTTSYIGGVFSIVLLPLAIVVIWPCRSRRFQPNGDPPIS
jgi:Flp pilus assembly protein protease CpaA